MQSKMNIVLLDFWKLTFIQEWRQIEHNSILNDGGYRNEILKYWPNELFCSASSTKNYAQPNDIHDRYQISTKTNQHYEHDESDFDAKFVESIVEKIFD